jgi:hypothetical protein
VRLGRVLIYSFIFRHQIVVVKPTPLDTDFPRAKMTIDELPFWLVNVPKGEWPAECPEYLANTSAKNKRILSTKDKDFQRHTWPEVVTLISKEKK